MPAVATKPSSKDIYALHKQGLSFRDIAGQLGIGMAAVIVAIRNRESAEQKNREQQRVRNRERIGYAKTMLVENAVDSQLKSHQIKSIWEEHEVHQSPANIAVTLDIPLHDVKRILKALDEDEGNLQRVILTEKLGKELLEAIESDLIDNQDERILRNVYGNLNFQEILQAICHSSGPREREWIEHCRQYQHDWNRREALGDSIHEWAFPRRCLSILQNAGIESIRRLKTIIDGTDSEYHNLEQIPEVDVDCRDRIMAILNDETDSVLPNTIHYHGPLIEAIEAGPPAKCVVKFNEEPEDASQDTEL